YRAHWVTGNLAPVDALVRSLQDRGLNVLPVFGPQLGDILASGLLLPGLVDVLIATTSFSVGPISNRSVPPSLTLQSRASSMRPPPESQATGDGQVGNLSDGAMASLDVPVLQAIFCSSSENVWAANKAGLSPRDIAMNIALPEFDGRLITTAISFKNTTAYD